MQWYRRVVDTNFTVLLIKGYCLYSRRSRVRSDDATILSHGGFDRDTDKTQGVRAHL
jgi:hypothetical protein